MAPRNQQASATIGRKPSTVNIRFRTWPTISRAQRASGSPGTLPLVRPLLRVRVRTVRITQIPWDGATHLSTDMDVVRRGHSSNLSSRQQLACQPAVNRSTIATKRLTRPCKRRHLIMVIASTVTIDPERLTGLITYLSVLPRWTASQVQEMSTSITCSSTPYCCLYKIEG